MKKNNFNDLLDTLIDKAMASAMAGSYAPEEADAVRKEFQIAKAEIINEFAPKQVRYTADVSMPVLCQHVTGIPVLTGNILNDSKGRAIDGEFLRTSEVTLIEADDEGYAIVHTANSVYRCLGAIKLDFGSGKVG